MQGRSTSHGRLSISLREDVFRGSKPQRVDREQGVIYGVKILGNESQNKRRYPAPTIEKARPLYEGAPVNIDHPSKPGQVRSAYDRIGKLENVLVRGGELYADVRLLKTHPMADRLMEAAERMPEAFAFSHNADGKGRTDRDGWFVVEELTEVRSVDLVADAATNKTLFEGQQTMKRTLKAVFEAILPKLTAKRRPRLRAFLEMAATDPTLKGPMEQEVEPPAETASPEDALAAGFEATIMAIVQDTSMDAAAKAKKIAELLKTHEKLTASAETQEQEDEEEEATEEGDEEEEGEEKPTKEGRRVKLSVDAEVRQLREQVEKAALKEWIREQCQTHDVLWDKALEEGLVSMRDKPKITKHLEYLKKLKVGSSNGSAVRSGPRSQAPGAKPITEAKAPTDQKDLARWLQSV